MGKFKMIGLSIDGKTTLNVKGGKLINTPYSQFEMPKVTLNPGPELNYGEEPGSPGYISEDYISSEKLKHPGKVIHESGVHGVEAGQPGSGPGEDVVSGYENRKTRQEGGVPIGSRAGSSTGYTTSEKHENYEGIKNERSGYDDFSLGLPTETEKSMYERFGKTGGKLQRKVQEYMQDPASHTWSLNNVDNLTLNPRMPEYHEQFKQWQKNNPDGTKAQMDNEILNMMYLDNDLKVASEQGFTPDAEFMESQGLSGLEQYQSTAKGDELKRVHIHNLSLIHI